MVLVELDLGLAGSVCVKAGQARGLLRFINACQEMTTPDRRPPGSWSMLWSARTRPGKA
jgi:hypothetical protein